mmetsp:Transcript_14753/g.22241  ORF Transcript_14753/g.22241 Transcript_14753/m.22241 type:complete len:88 (+) Transcript_14753:126-389(+)|eukprot:CAMPEP_0185022466 /NCGR_PEP_ID=MMETSP1103-20130426/5171_1 /TAXON_ID=36769 /ORGANISM="Paraphysomonas bandaiensis, Strain Caron Lab Isolate" /LENGTH=87 /DNA_ID=CAMNT_0027554537 /DNA_START=108 /DNA_END=371 /DNA_ORIENTATION=-
MPDSKAGSKDSPRSDDSSGDKTQSNKLEGFSSPRKKLMQAKIQAEAIDNENNLIDKHKIRQNVSRNFVSGLISESLETISDTKITSK